MENYLISEDRRVGPGDYQASISKAELVAKIEAEQNQFGELPPEAQEAIADGFWEAISVLANPMQMGQFGQYVVNAAGHETATQNLSRRIDEQAKAHKRVVRWTFVLIGWSFIAGYLSRGLVAKIVALLP